VLRVEATLAAASAGEPAVSFRRTARFALTPHASTSVQILLAVACGSPAQGRTTVPAAACTLSVFCEERGQNNLIYAVRIGIELYRIDGAAGSHDNQLVNNTIGPGPDLGAYERAP
jgi:hypothetical protein